MLLALLILLVFVMLAGMLFALLGMRGRKFPLLISGLHGIAGITLIVLLVIHDLHFPHNTAVNAATVLLMLTATGGLLLFGFRAGRQPLPGLIVSLHAGFAAAALVLMLIGYVSA
ncbi:MAG: hypothetical protein KGJ08_04915 [Gammaproteobacteria bacterium]|nr:hypothetical protein [Gammaproteobacteria bacterium]